MYSGFSKSSSTDSRRFRRIHQRDKFLFWLPSPAGVDQFPLTEAQKEIWAGRADGGEASLSFNQSLKLEFRGTFDAELFRAAVQQIIKRHPILLASFTADGQCKCIDPKVKLEVPLIDVSAKEDRERELQRA